MSSSRCQQFFIIHFKKTLTLQPYLLLIILIDMIIYSYLIDDRNYIPTLYFYYLQYFFIKKLPVSKLILSPGNFLLISSITNNFLYLKDHL